jgi:hypothetical protein
MTNRLPQRFSANKRSHASDGSKCWQQTVAHRLRNRRNSLKAVRASTAIYMAVWAGYGVMRIWLHRMGRIPDSWSVGLLCIWGLVICGALVVAGRMYGELRVPASSASSPTNLTDLIDALSVAAEAERPILLPYVAAGLSEATKLDLKSLDRNRWAPLLNELGRAYVRTEQPELGHTERSLRIAILGAISLSNPASAATPLRRFITSASKVSMMQDEVEIASHCLSQIEALARRSGESVQLVRPSTGSLVKDEMLRTCSSSGEDDGTSLLIAVDRNVDE